MDVGFPIKPVLKALKHIKTHAAPIHPCGLVMCFLFSIIVFQNIVVRAQCNTTLNKLLPATAVNNDDRFGSALAANGQYMVVAAENSDTLGIYYGGAAYVYEKTVAGWAYRAMLMASDPDEYDFFGNQVAIDASGNTIVVINRNYTRGGVYIFQKPTSGWETMQETYNIKFPEYLEFNSALDVSDDGSTIVVSNPMSDNGLLYVLQKPISGWSNDMTPEVLATRIDNSGIWLGNDVLIHDDYIYATTSNEGNSIYVYSKGAATYEQIASLTTSQPAYYFGETITATANTIAVTGLAYQPDGTYTESFFLFKKDGEWADMDETIEFHSPDINSNRYSYPIQLISSTQMLASILIKGADGYYTGKILELTTSDGTWQDVVVETLFEERELSVPSEFGNDLIWTGSELVLTAVRKATGNTFRNAALSLTQSAGLWGSLQRITLPRNSSSNVNFGSSIVKTNDVMFAGAPYDGTMGRGAGAVYIYDRAGEDFVKVHTIFPSRRKIRPTNGSDAGFGYALAVHGDELAVGAPSFLYTPNSYGKVFIYKRNSDDWTSAVLYDSLDVPQDLMLNHIGAALAMNDHVLFVSAYNNFANEHTNAIVVFEKEDDKWIYKQLIKMGKPLDKSWPSVKLSLNGDQLAVGQYFTINGGVSIINKNQESGLWEVTASIGGNVFSGLGAAVKLLENHLFVGAPGLSFNDIYRSGAILVFTKLPGESWSSTMEASAMMGAQQPVEGAFFGSSLDVVGNTLAVGAPGMFLTFDSKVRTIPGNTYIIQSHDYYWTNTTQYLNLQGDRFAANERDHFGSQVALDQEYVYVGARSENTSTGQFSGAVYYIPSPPVIFLQPPVCKDAAPLVLNAYPFGGAWAGPGVDPLLGTFNPALVETGIFDLTYSTPNCSNVGTVQIEVKTPLAVEQLSPAEVMMCAEGSATLEVELVSEAVYNWYYRQESGDEFVWLQTDDASFVATNPGEYKAIVSMQCSAESPVFRVAFDNLNITVGPQPVLCSPSEPVSLVASSDVGVWEGTGVSDSQFNAAGLANGFYNLTYRITSDAGCHFVLKDSIKVNAVKPLTLSEISTDFCETGSAALQVIPEDNTLLYTWFYKESQDAALDSIDKTLSNKAEVYRQGYYQVTATNGECYNTSNNIEIGLVSDLPYSLTPAENTNIQLCNTFDFVLTSNARAGTHYTWQYKPVDSDDYLTLEGEITNQIVITETGSYTVQGEYGFCSFKSSPVLVHFVQDQLFVPNVFTPNGDEKNPVMKVTTTGTISRFTIFNRLGDEIYSNPSGEWDGGEASAGIYFWYLRYDGCDQQKEAKGWVQVLR